MLKNDTDAELSPVANEKIRNSAGRAIESHRAGSASRQNITQSMIKRTVLLVVAFVFSTIVSHAQSLPPGVTMHRAQTGRLDQSGWTRAVSTNGQFGVNLPCLYNDFSVDELEPGSSVRRVDTVGCLRQDGKKFSVTRVQYKNPKADAPYYFENGKRKFQNGAAKVSSLTVRGLPAFEVTSAEASRCAFVRMIHAFPDNFLLVAEAKGPACNGLEVLSRPFFDSLDINQEEKRVSSKALPPKIPLIGSNDN